MNKARRDALKKLGVGVVAGPAAIRSGFAEASIPSLSAGTALGNGAGKYNNPGTLWDRLGITEEAWKLLKREAELEVNRLNFYRNSMMGILDQDIAGMASLSHHAKARMQTQREIARKERQEELSRKLFPGDY